MSGKGLLNYFIWCMLFSVRVLTIHVIMTLKPVNRMANWLFNTFWPLQYKFDKPISKKMYSCPNRFERLVGYKHLFLVYWALG